MFVVFHNSWKHTIVSLTPLTLVAVPSSFSTAQEVQEKHIYIEPFVTSCARRGKLYCASLQVVLQLCYYLVATPLIQHSVYQSITWTGIHCATFPNRTNEQNCYALWI